MSSVYSITSQLDNGWTLVTRSLHMPEVCLSPANNPTDKSLSSPQLASRDTTASVKDGETCLGIDSFPTVGLYKQYKTLLIHPSIFRSLFSTRQLKYQQSYVKSGGSCETFKKRFCADTVTMGTDTWTMTLCGDLALIPSFVYN